MLSLAGQMGQIFIVTINLAPTPYTLHPTPYTLYPKTLCFYNLVNGYEFLEILLCVLCG
ncbi:MAG: hypothetical protein LBP59_02535 [Planctomycetaceae bacterium]|nr:hypothetical protein [Planctomycetaceae bacterium]